MKEITNKFVVRGVEALSDCELLTLILNDESLADGILSEYGGEIQAVSADDYKRLRLVEGLGASRAMRLVAAREWGRRSVLAESQERRVIESSADVVSLFRSQIVGLKHEECWVLYLNAANRILEQSRVSQGGVMATTVDHRLVIKRALELLSTHIILVHNHPSGSVEPSREDVAMTQKIKSAAALFDIKLLDHMILSAESEYSFAAAGTL